jgi:phage shock protein E
MLQSLLNLLGFGPKIDFALLKKEGAIILDVRSKGEYAQGHIPQSINISVDQLLGNLNKLHNKETPIITCCASGMRSGMAKRMLLSSGYLHVHNGGTWKSLQSKLY